MTDSRTSRKYIQALKEISKLDKEPVGLTDFSTQVSSSNIPIRKNNLIIQLVLSLAKKLDQVEEQIAEINQVLHNASSSLPPSLLDKLENLTLSANNNRRPKLNPFDNRKWNSLEKRKRSS